MRKYLAGALSGLGVLASSVGVFAANDYSESIGTVVSEGTSFLTALMNGFTSLIPAILLLMATVFGFFWVLARIRRGANQAR